MREDNLDSEQIGLYVFCLFVLSIIATRFVLTFLQRNINLRPANGIVGNMLLISKNSSSER